MDEPLRNLRDPSTVQQNRSQQKKQIEQTSTLPETTSPPSDKFAVPRWIQMGIEKTALALGTVAFGAIAVGLFPATLIGIGLEMYGESTRASTFAEILTLPLFGIEQLMNKWEELDNELDFERMNKDSFEKVYKDPILKSYCEKALEENPDGSYKEIMKSIHDQLSSSPRSLDNDERRMEALIALRKHAPFLFG